MQDAEMKNKDMIGWMETCNSEFQTTKCRVLKYVREGWFDNDFQNAPIMNVDEDLT